MWIHRIRLKALAWLVAIILAAVGAISFFAIPAIPALSVAVAVIAVALNQIGHRLTQPTCYGCGGDLSGRPPGQYGVVCSECGTINQVAPGASSVSDDRRQA
ncbi:MAG: hypothetical protein L6Q35_08970 [Phycisphaerales bacterium]|nr:hypothetical protein [Phycisphaerales bacterium]